LKLLIRVRKQVRRNGRLLLLALIPRKRLHQLTGSELTQTVASISGAPFAFHAKLTEVASLFSTRELAVVANVGSLRLWG
jgi:hypothetical protein